jgi:transcriptional regulator with XRE-family HTH domain
MADMPLSGALRRAIRDSGLSYLKLEQETGVHRASVSRFVAGDRSLRLDVADKLAAYLGLTLAPAEEEGLRAPNGIAQSRREW